MYGVKRDSSEVLRMVPGPEVAFSERSCVHRAGRVRCPLLFVSIAVDMPLLL